MFKNKSEKQNKNTRRKIENRNKNNYYYLYVKLLCCVVRCMFMYVLECAWMSCPSFRFLKLEEENTFLRINGTMVSGFFSDIILCHIFLKSSKSYLLS